MVACAPKRQAREEIFHAQVPVGVGPVEAFEGGVLGPHLPIARVISGVS